MVSDTFSSDLRLILAEWLDGDTKGWGDPLARLAVDRLDATCPDFKRIGTFNEVYPWVIAKLFDGR